MSVPPLPHLILLFFLGGVFIHFFYAGARTLFIDPRADNEPAAALAQGSFLLGGIIPIWFLGLYQPIHLLNGIIAACVLATSIALYEWARATIWGRRFGVALGAHVPDSVCEQGPDRFLRHPLYLSYLLAFTAAFVAIPHWITALILAGNIGLFAYAASNDERTIAASPLAADYAAYRARAGMFWPRLG